MDQQHERGGIRPTVMQLRRFMIAVFVLALSGVMTTPMAQASPPATGGATITTAPGLVARLTAADLSISVQPPATSKSTGRSPASTQARIAMRFPLRQTLGTNQYSFSGALVIRNEQSGREVTLQDITVDLPSGKVFVRVRQIFGLRIEAFTVADPGTQTSRVRRSTDGRVRITAIRGATLAVSPVVGNRVNEILGLSGSNDVFSPGTVIGIVDMRIVTKL